MACLIEGEKNIRQASSFHNMKKFIISLAATLLSIYGNCQDNSLFRVRIVYDEPVDGYTVSGYFYPFDAICETGWVELHFVPVDGGKELVFSNVGKYEEGHPDWPEKFSGKNICDLVFSDSFKGFKDGETLHWKYYTTHYPFEESPLFYDAEFQFFDVDFDGQDEFLLNEYDKGRGGNTYVVYEITPDGFEKKMGEPFDEIVNSTEFYPDEKIIVNYIYEWPYGKKEYIISNN